VDEAPAAPREKRRKPHERKQQDLVNLNQRVAARSTITFHEGHGDKLRTRSDAAAAARESPKRVCRRL